MKAVADYIHAIPDFPEPGVMFQDITTILQDAEGLHLAVDGLREVLRGVDYDLIVGPEPRGFIFGVSLAYTEYKLFTPIRRQGRLPAETISKTYELKYGHATIEIHKNTIKPGQRVVIVDDLITTGEMTEAMVRLIEKLGSETAEMLFVTELEGLYGREKPKGYPVFSLMSYEGKQEQVLSASGSAFYGEKSEQMMRRQRKDGGEEMRACIHIYTGGGKGKTNAAMGLTLRMAGYGKRVFLTQFLKDGSPGGLLAPEKPPELHCLRLEEHPGFFWTLDDTEKERGGMAVQRYLAEILEVVEQKKPTLPILGKGVAAYRLGLVPWEHFLDFLDRKPEDLELVLTGWGVPEGPKPRADYVSEIVRREHPFGKGIPAREGVEF